MLGFCVTCFLNDKWCHLRQCVRKLEREADSQDTSDLALKSHCTVFPDTVVPWATNKGAPSETRALRIPHCLPTQARVVLLCDPGRKSQNSYHNRTLQFGIKKSTFCDWYTLKSQTNKLKCLTLNDYLCVLVNAAAFSKHALTVMSFSISMFIHPSVMYVLLVLGSIFIFYLYNCKVTIWFFKST